MAVVFEEERTDISRLRPAKPGLTDKVATSLGIPLGTATLLLGCGAAVGFVASYFLFSHAHVFSAGPDKASIERIQNSLRVVH